MEDFRRILGVTNGDVNELREIWRNIQDDEFVRMHFGSLANAFRADIKDYISMVLSSNAERCWLVGTCVNT